MKCVVKVGLPLSVLCSVQVWFVFQCVACLTLMERESAGPCSQACCPGKCCQGGRNGGLHVT